MTKISPTAVVRNGLRFFIPLSIALTVYLYLFPVFSKCAFPLPAHTIDDGTDSRLSAFFETAQLHYPATLKGENATVEDGNTTLPSRLAPFRLLTLADPQLEGDTSIPNYYGELFPHLSSLFRHLTFQSWHSSLLQRVRQSLHDVIDIFFDDIPNNMEAVRKRIDLFGNDFYLAHIYRTVHWWTKPTHVTVLGDLVGSQWLEDPEFDRRAARYWNRVFRHGSKVPDLLAGQPADEYDLAGYLGEPVDNETEAWTTRIINVAGNHDIGYAGDINDERVERFEREFGKPNYELRFELPISSLNLNESMAASVYDDNSNFESSYLVPELRLVILNDMNLDTPALSQELQDATYSFINGIINTASAVEFKGHFTLVLTHVPLYKPAGICVDDPFFDFHEHDGSLKEQNQLSDSASRGFLEGIYGMSRDSNAPGAGMGRRGLILNGHDHAGCDVWHFVNQSRELVISDEGEEDKGWEVRRYRHASKDGLVPPPQGVPGIREITVRSMMGDFGGNAGLLSLWFDAEAWEWRYEWATCPLGTQHMWWLVHIMDLIVVVGIFAYIIMSIAAAAGVDVDGLLIHAGEKVVAAVREWASSDAASIANKKETVGTVSKGTTAVVAPVKSAAPEIAKSEEDTKGSVRRRITVIDLMDDDDDA